MTTAVEWLVSMMVLLSPPELAEKRVTFPEARETAAQAFERYHEIGGAIYRAAYDPDEAPLFMGPFGRARTATLMLAVVHAESGLRKDVQLGKGAHAFGPNGDCGLAQFNLGVGGRTAEGWNCTDLVADLDKTFRAELHLLRKSMKSCKDNQLEDRLAVYTGGACDRGLLQSRARMGIARRTFNRVARPERDAEWILPRPEKFVDASVPCIARCGILRGNALGE